MTDEKFKPETTKFIAFAMYNCWYRFRLTQNQTIDAPLRIRDFSISHFASVLMKTTTPEWFLVNQCRRCKLRENCWVLPKTHWDTKDVLDIPIEWIDNGSHGELPINPSCFEFKEEWEK